MKKKSGGEKPRFAGTKISELREGVDQCRACPLWERATQGVPGEGTDRARVMIVGEQPGDQEDRAGRPFVGPAGGVLDAALERIGLDRNEVYVTNVVKHFSWLPRGKRRIHKTPTQSEIAACLDWLTAELRIVKPRVIVCRGQWPGAVRAGDSASFFDSAHHRRCRAQGGVRAICPGSVADSQDVGERQRSARLSRGARRIDRSNIFSAPCSHRAISIIDPLDPKQ